MPKRNNKRWNKRIALDLQKLALERLRGKYAAWIDKVMPIVAGCACDYSRFTTDDVFKRLEAAGYRKPKEPRAMGCVMRLARSIKWVEPTNLFVTSDRVSNHARPMRVWKSKLYRNAQVY